MKHISASRLDELEAMLAGLRTVPGLVEKKRGVFYRKGRAFLHFHEDPQGLFADIRAVEGSNFDRFDLTKPAGREALLIAARQRLA